MGASV